MGNETENENSLGGLMIGPAACSFAGLLAAVSIDKADSHVGHAIEIFALSIPIGVFGYVLLVISTIPPFGQISRFAGAFVANIAWTITIFGIHSLFGHFSDKAANLFLSVGLTAYGIILAIISVSAFINLKRNKARVNAPSISAPTTPEAAAKSQ
jgi:hypothetical protein